MSRRATHEIRLLRSNALYIKLLFYSKQFGECEDTQAPFSDSKVCFASTFYLKLVAVIEFIALLSSTGAGCYTRSQADKPPQYHLRHVKSQQMSFPCRGGVVYPEKSVDV